MDSMASDQSLENAMNMGLLDPDLDNNKDKKDSDYLSDDDSDNKEDNEGG